MGRSGKADSTVLTVWARAVEARYGRREPALRGMDLEVAPGQVVGVLGPNGAGKSTLLRLLATALRPCAGSLTLLGVDSARPTSRLRRSIGWSPDEPAHVEALTGPENALFFALAAGLARDEARRRVVSLMERLRLSDEAARPVSDYSFGMRRKLALAEALAHEPALIVMDEPTTGLDPAGREALRGILAERAAAGSSVILATNDVIEAERVAHRVVFLAVGRKVLEGEPRDLIARLGGSTRISVRLTAPNVPLVEVPGLSIAAADTEHLVAHSGNGTAQLPGLCAALVAAGATIREITVRPPDLGDVFLKATGTELKTTEAPGTPR